MANIITGIGCRDALPGDPFFIRTNLRICQTAVWGEKDENHPEVLASDPDPDRF